MCPIQVSAYAGYKGEQRPTHFLLGGRTHQIRQVIDQWYEPHSTYFRVETEEGHFYILQHQKDSPEGSWTLVSFRRADVRKTADSAAGTNDSAFRDAGSGLP